MKTFIVIVFIIIFVVLCFLASSAVIYFVWNALAGYFGFKKITFLIAIFIDVALWIISGLFKQTQNK